MTVKRAWIAGEPLEWRERITAALLGSSLAVESFASGVAVLERIGECVELLVVASQTADVSGVALCRRVRELPVGESIAVVVVSGHADEMDRILAFENGADDFVSEPFSAREFAVRVRAILRRSQRTTATEPLGEIDTGALRIDLHGGIAELHGQRLRLTLREFEVLRLLVQSEGRVVKRVELLRALDGEPRASERLIDTHVKSIRSKLGDARDFIETVRGIGYRFDPRRRAANPVRARSA